ncbi:peptide deformylase [Rubrobacter taiwanensis]|jgi:peptide deformylase|uniref:Peptide deformylase n=1 Tax=Rubrobacter taiwanensis TaxID=185139 RepID=A0A4R1BJ77_9ACTN|nr:peptide deformylase [Rubrobacter taiwanensis]TCJ17277.1 peptide deformylase [Rubrobacter taiwanensis]
MTLEIRKFGDPVLKSQATPVESFDESLERLAQEMLRTMRRAEGVGLAANQVGYLRRIFVAALGEDEEFVIVNPEIEELSGETVKDSEGCLSIPGIQVEVERAGRVVLSGRNLKGEPVTLDAEGVLARVFQHEIDHLDGVLILDRTDRESRKAALRAWRERQMAARR